MTQTATFPVTGMSCASCAGRAERALTAVPGVTEASINLAANSARVTFGAPATPTTLAAALQKAGYPMAEAEARLTVDGMTCASCTGRVERALQAAPGVLAASVNLATHTAQVRYTPGTISPTELAQRVTKAGYPAQPAKDTPAPDTRQPEDAVMKRRALIAAALTLPVVVLAMGGHMVPAFHHWIMASIGTQTSWLIQFALTAAVLAGPGRIFLRIGLPALARMAPEMNSLVALGSLAAFGYSSVATFAPALLPATAREVYFEAAATIVTLILVGRWLEARAKGQAGEAIRRLVGLRPATARVDRGGETVELPVEELAPGDIVLLAPGERVAVDGILTDGHGWIDESMLTGEPAPVEKTPGAPVTGGTVNGAAALAFRVTATGADTVLARIIRLVEDAQGGKLPVQALVDRITRWFVPAVMALAAVTFLIWLALGPEPHLTHALVAGISVLIIACPCAMGLATPVSILVGTGRGAELGILFRRGDALQRLAEVRSVAFDKTGTLTEGRPVLTDLELAPGVDEAELLALVASAEARSEHPLAHAILAAAKEQGLTLPRADSARAVPGKGLVASVGGHVLLIGNAALLEGEGVDLAAKPDENAMHITSASVLHGFHMLAARAETLAAEGKTPVLVAVDGRLAAVLAVSDPLKPGAAAAVAALRALGVESTMISGDNRLTAEAVAARIGISNVVAGVLPEGKLQALSRLPAPTAFVGDGINDAPALAAADVGIAMGTGTDVAIESADIVVISGDPQAVASAINLSRATLRNIRQNLFWAFSYNVLLIPVAAGALYPLNGMLLSPMLAAGAMAFSSVFVVTNALRLRRAG
ncbi:heavy metal translocating P-type ATPase [Frigidibacter albus]|uniref:P-type Cu(+) transporter n=1 Tax=Frigidibacter albus TaxID=1465486 RepID=A0A6L8VLC4_9RHOB|nr:heavy metal translocating P-type ATPase [Frigidibacter albus]MZQ90516.1 heavy metal translocating P-type ATPase [Frigidibacter albus]NBE32364.1 heavy metal translocating P-type ATPase [Frigidibacter albus]GGH59372.1 copper-translocating P-type ATPase [Frigidibacter albus]